MVGFEFRQTNLGGGVGGGVYLHRVGRGGVVRFYLHKLFGWLRFSRGRRDAIAARAKW